ncbi:MAG: 4Fe-4S binding protein [Aeriscardovia sp.]|nr:4Fe-4S binding protein [Aeriscardovia sp.]MBQ1802991.1 4Fe-4S binding protein [Aeriscardovia sp.]
MTYVIAYPCVDVKDKSCLEVCPVDCIYEGERMMYINPDECIDCGACEAVCPVQAIFYQDSLPNDWKWFEEASESFFETEKEPGKVYEDPEKVRDLPRKGEKT